MSGDAERGPMTTLHLGLRVVDLVGEVPETGLGHLTTLKLPDDEFVTIDVVHDPHGAR